jgi:hypothetical protein
LFIRILLLLLGMFNYTVCAAELALHLEADQSRVQLVIANDTDTPFIIDEDTFRLSANGKLYLDIRSKNAVYKLAVLKNDRNEPFNISLKWGELIGRLFYLTSLKRDYGLAVDTVYTMTAFLCSNVNAEYDGLALKRDLSSCLISNSVEFRLK